MKKQLILLVMILLPMVASAYDFALENSDGVTIYYNYILNGKETELEVTSFNPYYHNSYNKNVVIPEEVTYMNRTLKVTHIGSYAFYKCTGLTSVTIPNSVISIDEGAFRNCSVLTSLNIPNSVMSIGTSAFEDCSVLTSLNIPNSVMFIGSYAFRNCSGLTSVIIPNSVTSIEEHTFQNCTGLTSVTIPNSVKSIEASSFYNCSGLTSVIIPNSVTSIGYNAFDGINLTFVISQIENPFNITGKSSSHPTFSLNTYNNATLYVPKGTSDKYKAAKGWKDFLYIEEGITNIISNVPANAVLMRSQNGTITIQGVDEGEQVSVFGINGTQAGTSVSQNGAAIVNTTLQPGSIAIVKIGQKSVKVVIK